MNLFAKQVPGAPLAVETKDGLLLREEQINSCSALARCVVSYI
ncbi:hypothetical protein [Zooshikella ganghwensis]|nr:hypothetical protein [Zooshikella ganghwensis]